MKRNITNEFDLAVKKGLEVYYNDSSGDFEVQTTPDEIISFYDDAKGKGLRELKKFIKNW